MISEDCFQKRSRARELEIFSIFYWQTINMKYKTFKISYRLDASTTKCQFSVYSLLIEIEIRLECLFFLNKDIDYLKGRNFDGIKF